jgi:hypothetical protein
MSVTLFNGFFSCWKMPLPRVKRETYSVVQVQKRSFESEYEECYAKQKMKHGHQ